MRPKQKGYTLVELMVAMFLGLLVSIAALQLFISSRQTAGSQRAASQTQDQGQMILNTLVSDLRSAGESPSNLQGVNTQSVGLPSEVVVGNSSWPSSLATPPDSDSFSGSNSVAVTYLVDATQQTPTDCNGYPETVNNGVSQILNVYYVAKSASYTASNPVLSLWCLGNGTGSTAQELAQGVDVMRVLYGVDNTIDGTLAPTQWVSDPNSLNASLGYQAPVVAVRIALLMQSSQKQTTQPSKASSSTGTSIQVLNCVVPTTCATTVQLTDGYLRRLFVGTTLLRNNLFPAGTQW